MPPLRLIAPAIGFVAFVYAIPTLLNLAFSLTSFTSYSTQVEYVGLENYRAAFTTSGLAQALWVTIQLGLVIVVLQNGLGLALALMLTRQSPISHLTRTLLLGPIVIAPLAAGYIWRAIFAFDGPINQLLGVLTGQEVHIQWLASPSAALLIVAVASVWKGLGVTVLIYVVGLIGIPREVRESAVVEGATRLSAFRYITLPLIVPSVIVSLVLSLLGALYAFDMVQATTGGGPGNATTVLNVLIYQNFGRGEFGIAAAMSMALYVAVAVATIPLVLLLRKREVEF